MPMLFRRHADRATGGLTFYDRCARVCTPRCRSAARLDRVRTQALVHPPPLR